MGYAVSHLRKENSKPCKAYRFHFSIICVTIDEGRHHLNNLRRDGRKILIFILKETVEHHGLDPT
jgi:hypothetical protein